MIHNDFYLEFGLQFICTPLGLRGRAPPRGEVRPVRQVAVHGLLEAGSKAGEVVHHGQEAKCNGLQPSVGEALRDGEEFERQRLRGGEQGGTGGLLPLLEPAFWGDGHGAVLRWQLQQGATLKKSMPRCTA